MGILSTEVHGSEVALFRTGFSYQRQSLGCSAPSNNLLGLGVSRVMVPCIVHRRFWVGPQHGKQTNFKNRTLVFPDLKRFWGCQNITLCKKKKAESASILSNNSQYRTASYSCWLIIDLLSKFWFTCRVLTSDVLDYTKGPTHVTESRASGPSLSIISCLSDHGSFTFPGFPCMHGEASNGSGSTCCICERHWHSLGMSLPVFSFLFFNFDGQFPPLMIRRVERPMSYHWKVRGLKPTYFAVRLWIH